jgi:hypothetical protein
MSGARALLAVAFLAAAAPRQAAAMTLRYALVVGTNEGRDPETGSLPSLLHAEGEAAKLHDALVESCNFEPTSARTVLLLHPSRAELLEAIRHLGERVSADKARHPEASALFGFFFTGHGLAGRLVLPDGPLDRADLAALFRAVSADFTVGMFDACYSGSLSELSAKGVTPTPGVNVLHQLPNEVLNAEGSVWFVSSGPEQVSYEDNRLGGVFTHFFTEALREADPAGPGITLERIWDYAQGRTVAYTTARSRPQRPQQIVSRMKANGPVYFSFPRRRDASLVFSEAVAGSFLLSYRDGELNEVVDKGPGVAEELAVYPGRARLSMMSGGEVRAEQDVELRPGSRLVISEMANAAEAPPIGQRVDLVAKGVLLDGGLVSARVIEPNASLLVGAGFEYDGGRRALLGAQYAGQAILHFDRDRLATAAVLALGHDRQRFSAWGYRVESAAVELRGGYAVDLDRVRLGMMISVGAGALFQTFDSGRARSGASFEPGLALSAVYALGDDLGLELFLRAADALAPGAGAGAPSSWSPVLGAGASALFRAF